MQNPVSRTLSRPEGNDPSLSHRPQDEQSPWTDIAVVRPKSSANGIPAISSWSPWATSFSRLISPEALAKAARGQGSCSRIAEPVPKVFTPACYDPNTNNGIVDDRTGADGKRDYVKYARHQKPRLLPEKGVWQ
jgi:hypothetical protein